MTSKLYRVPPQQIPEVWELIKFTVARSNGIPENISIVKFFTRLLFDLLGETSQCFVRMNEKREVLATMVTSIIEDELYKDKKLNIIGLYSFFPVDNETWLRDYMKFREFAKNRKCKEIITRSTNERMIEIGKKLGFKQHSVNLYMEV